jgi:hypothetical protein
MRLPEHVEQQQVEAEGGAEHAGLEGQRQGVELLRALLDRRPRTDDGDERHERGEQGEQPAHAIDAEVIAGADLGSHASDSSNWNPGAPGTARHHSGSDTTSSTAAARVAPQTDRTLRALGQQRDEHRRDEQEEDEEGQPGIEATVTSGSGGRSSTITPSMMNGVQVPTSPFPCSSFSYVLLL